MKSEGPKFPKIAGVNYADGMYARVPVDGKFYQIPVEIKRQTPVPIEGATSFIYRKMINGKRPVIKLGKDLQVAFIQWRNLEADAGRIKQGKNPLNVEPKRKLERLSIHDAVEAYLFNNADKVLKNKRRPRSAEAYNKAVIDFRDSVEVNYMDEITVDVLKAHEDWLIANLERRRIGKKENSIANRFIFLNIFFRKNGIKMTKDRNAKPDDPGLFDFDDVPKSKPKVIDTYSEDEVRALMAASTIDEADLIQFFLNLGVRDEEAKFAMWSDIKKEPGGGYVFHVQEKEAFNWRPKNGSDRKIDINQKLFERLITRKDRIGRTKHNLIFPNSKETPDDHLIERLHKVWCRVQESAEKNGTLELSGRAELHRFRRTFITNMLAKGTPIRDVMTYSGHTDLKSFMRYIKASTSLGRAGIEKMASYGD